MVLKSPPPFSGTIFIDPDIVTDTDRSAFESLNFTGQAERQMYDRRVEGLIRVQPFLFNASYNDGLSLEIQVNPEFENRDQAEVEALKYADVIGRIPTVLRMDVETVSIHAGVQPFGGGNYNLLIHTGQASLYEEEGILEETLFHEAAHTSLDATHAKSSDWILAQQSDSSFISTYARDNPYREDIAESFLTYVAVNYRSERISQSLKETIIRTIPNRISYFENQQLDLYPVD